MSAGEAAVMQTVRNIPKLLQVFNTVLASGAFECLTMLLVKDDKRN